MYKSMIHYLRFSALFATLLWTHHGFALDVSGKVQAGIYSAESPNTWLDKGTGVTRFDTSGIHVQQAIIQINQSVTPSTDIQADASYYPDGDQHLGFTQFQIRYKPLISGNVKWRARAGFFYPAMSLENVDKGWLSPYTYTQSAINSWLGEELRVAGAEFTLYRPGRAARSPWSWELHAAAYKGNDPLGTVLTWRGFALHDRQSLHHERLEFAAYPSVTDSNGIWHPSWVEPFSELDAKWGIYIGAHLDYQRQAKLRYYYYDNLANPNAVNHQRLYAWRTRFHSLAFQHNISSSTRIIAQWMLGDTLMGERFVYTDFQAFYAMISHKAGQHRFSARGDVFDVREDDIFPNDQNNSHGSALTANWRYNLSEHWQLGAEYSLVSSRADNRVQLNEAIRATQQQMLLVLEYNW
ncbi:hypothetical protein KO518_16855 [Aestuariibacter sp. A3R04]|nr:hypothetical protein [Aestuariibacter sp. A3R04]